PPGRRAARHRRARAAAGAGRRRRSAQVLRHRRLPAAVDRLRRAGRRRRGADLAARLPADGAPDRPLAGHPAVRRHAGDLPLPVRALRSRAAAAAARFRAGALGGAVMGERRNEEQGRHRRFARRAIILGGGKLLLLGALAGRMYYLQVVEGDKYKLLAEDNRVSIRLLPPPRGRILDRFGEPLADNRQNYRMLLVSEQIKDLDAILNRLDSIVPLNETDRERIHKDIKRTR